MSFDTSFPGSVSGDIAAERLGPSGTRVVFGTSTEDDGREVDAAKLGDRKVFPREALSDTFEWHHVAPGEGGPLAVL
ncbi:hypothetical protein CCMA1212_002308 [Trichoderma ghanense]|uniref:Uncharacterized protein n=1 Tax=Trichoderma ghanense TaxID=65468 RepID=A0ABY2HEX5_9HYPO